MVINAGNNFDIESHDMNIALPYVIKALALSGTDVIAPGVAELVCGSRNLNRVASTSSIQLVSANVPGFVPYVVLPKNKGRTKVLVTSVVDPELLKKNPLIKANGITDPVTALHRVQQQISHDFFVVVIHADADRMPSIIQKCPEIDLVIDAIGDHSDENQDPNAYPVIVSNNRQGEYVAYIDYNGDSSGPDFSVPKRRRATVGRVAEDTQIAKLVEAYEAKRQKILQRQSDAEVDAGMPVEGGSEYVGSQSCMRCHSEIGDAWAKTRHAGAMNSLIQRSRQNDPRCISCHVTGMEKQSSPEGVWRRADHSMAGVQCEACHGPGADHARSPDEFDMLSVNENTCMKCHTQFKDPDFDFTRDIYKVNHGQAAVGMNGSRQQNEPSLN